MFDHVGLNVRDYETSRAFYEQALAPLGYGVAMEFAEHRAVAFSGFCRHGSERGLLTGIPGGVRSTLRILREG